MANKGKLFLIPNTLGSSSFENTIPSSITQIINEIDVYIVENVKEARRLLKLLGIQKPISALHFFELNKHTEPTEIGSFLLPLLEGKNTGVISDAGCPGIADPGSEIVRLAHEKNIKVIPLVGPSSILLALMASGFNGQNFVFHGYLPKDRKERIAKLKQIEKTAIVEKQTQLFIETPYRNDHLIEDIIRHCRPSTRFCVAANLSCPSEKVISRPIEQWKKNNMSFHKMPAVFLLYNNRNN